ncbi:MAG: hypothetical protein FD146_422 [Anaerolineaceae bacterium]|nr:MAG: hypothetical protein FD146_422 [Anaerolineaceae bacterium]
MSKKSTDKSVNVTIVIAVIGLVGTVIAALLGSPLLEKWLEKPPAPTATNPPDATLIFSEDFEDGVASGFTYYVGTWEIAKDKSNYVLKATALPSGSDVLADAVFGPSDFSNGIVEFRIKFIQLGGVLLDFRYQNQQKYCLYLFPPPDQEIGFIFTSADTDWYYQRLPQAQQPFTFQENVWYLIKLEARGEEMIVFIDNNRITSATDDRLLKGRLMFELLSPDMIIYLDDIKVWSFDQ